MVTRLLKYKLYHPVDVSRPDLWENWDDSWDWHVANNGGRGGVDLEASVGTPVRAPTDGWVTRTANLDGAGYSIFLRHEFNEGWSDVFSHLSKYETGKGLPGEGDHVNQGDTIAYSGNSAGDNSVGAHLHRHLVDPNGDRRNPKYYFTEEDPVPTFRRNTNETTKAIPSDGNTWTNLYATADNDGVFIVGPKQVSVAATVAVAGLLTGQTISVRIGRTGESGAVVDTVGRSTVGGRSAGLVYVNVAGICDLPADRRLRLQAITTATGVSVESVDVVTHHWAG